MSFNDIVPPRRSSLSAPSPQPSRLTGRWLERSCAAARGLFFFGSFPSYAKLNFADVFLRVICASSPSANGPEMRGVHPRVFCLLHFAGKCARNRIFYTVIRFYIVLYHIIQYYHKSDYCIFQNMFVLGFFGIICYHLKIKRIK